MNFLTVQRQFAAHIRNPNKHPAPVDINPERMEIYCDLVYSSINQLLTSNFPVLRTLHDDGQWQTLIRGFICDHGSTTPYFPQLAEEFLQYLQMQDKPAKTAAPFLLELAHYEWMELKLATTDAIVDKNLRIDQQLNLLDNHPVVSPLAWLLAYQWPVHHLGPEYQPQTPPKDPSYLLLYRDDHDTVQFMAVNAVIARLFELLKEDHSLSGRDALMTISTEMSHPDPSLVINTGDEMLSVFRQKNIILGAISTNH